jgi:hypothetical protein
MKHSVDKQKFYGKRFYSFKIYKNFSRVGRKREGEDVSRLIFAAVDAVEFLRESIATINQRKVVRVTQNPTFKFIEGRALGRALRSCEIGDRETFAVSAFSYQILLIR